MADRTDDERQAAEVLDEDGTRLATVDARRSTKPQHLDRDVPERQQWGNDIQFLLSTLGYGVGFGNVWRFPYLVYRYGGGAFLIPFLFFVAFVALPLMFLEVTVAQYAGIGPLHIYSSICPAMKGCGMTAMYIAYVNSVQYILILAYVVRYTATSFTRHLPWMDCDPTFSHDGCYGTCRGEDPEGKFVVIGKVCRPADQFCTKNEQGGVSCKGESGQELVIQDAAFSFFYDHVLAMRHADGTVASFSRYGYVVPSVFGAMFASYVMTGLVLEQGVTTAGKVVYFTATFPYFGLLVLLVRTAMLPGFMEGIKFYLIPDFSKLWSFEIWYQALSQTYFSMGVGFGGVMTLASYNDFNTPLYKMCVVTASVNVLTSLLAGMVIFGALGYIAQLTGQSIDQVAGSGISLTFVTFPTVLGLLPAAPVWAIVFFIMLITVGIDTQMGDMETQITGTLDNFPKLRKYKSLVTFGICLIGLAGAFTMTFQAGFWLNGLLNDYAATAPVLLLAMGNVFAFVYVYGFKRVMGHMQEMIGPVNKFNWWYIKITWMIIAPGFTIFLLGYFFFDFRGTAYDKPAEPELYEAWVQWVGVLMAAVPIIFIPAGVVHHFFKTRKRHPEMTAKEAFFFMFKPDKYFVSQKQRKELRQMGYLEMIQPTHVADYVLPSGLEAKRRASPAARRQTKQSDQPSRISDPVRDV